MTQTSIADAIATAQAAAAASVPSTVGSAGTAVASHAPVQAGAPLGLDDLLGNGISVDAWLKMTADGIKVGDKTKPLDNIVVYLDMSEIAYNYSIKYQLNGSAVYHKSYDRVTDAQGGPWMATLQKAQAIDSKAYEYRSAELPFIAAEAVASKEAGKSACNPGDRLGLALATTAWRGFEAFVKDLARKNIDPKTALLKVTLGFETKQKAGVNDWGIPVFVAYEEIETLPLFDTVH